MSDKEIQLTAIFAEIASAVITLEKNNPNNYELGKSVRKLINNKLKLKEDEVGRL